MPHRTFRDQVREWADGIEVLGEASRLIWCKPEQFGSDEASYRAAKRIAANFSSLRQAERKKLNKEMKRQGEQPLRKVAYEGIECTVVAHSQGGYAARFAALDSEEFTSQYEVQDDNEQPLNQLTWAEIERDILHIAPLARVKMLPAAGNKQDDLADLPLDIDPFTGERLDEAG